MTFSITDRIPVKNIENDEKFNITWPWDRSTLEPGVSIILRVKNEAESLPHVLTSLFSTTAKQIILIDNASTDNTVKTAEATADKLNARHRLQTHSYPHAIARCGPEHLNTSAASVHSLPYFYNWSYSLAQTSYVMKWDGDMVFTPKGIEQFEKMLPKLLAQPTVLQVPRSNLYVKNETTAWLDLGWRNKEMFGWPTSPETGFVKSFDWEIPMWREDAVVKNLHQASCLELKWLAHDEFAHWTPESFTVQRNKRKLREQYIYQNLREGKKPQVNGLVPITSENKHVIDFVKEDWLPAAPRPLIANAIETYR